MLILQKTKLKNKIVTLLLVVLSAHGAFCQNLNKLKFNWKKPGPWTEIPDQFKNEDAVTIYQEIYLSNIYDPSSSKAFTANISRKQRIRILTKSALDDLSNFEIAQFPGTRPVTIDARTIKKNGTTVPADRESIKEIKKFNKRTGEYTHEYKIAIPGVEVGDDIEVVYAVEKDYLVYSDDIYLHGDYPILRSDFTLYTSKGIITDIYNHNGMIQPTITEETDMTVDVWHLENLMPLKDQMYCIEDNELPFVRIHIDKIFTPGMSRPYEVGVRSWSDMYDGLTGSVFNKNAKTKGLDDFFNEHKAALDSLDKFGKVSFIVNYMNKEMKIVRLLGDNDKDLPLATLIKNKLIDDDNMQYFYKYMFKYLNIPASMAIAKNKFRGELAFDEKTWNQVSDLIFTFKEDNGITHFLYPSDHILKYHVDERPFYLEDTKLILLQKQDPDDRTPAVVSFSTIPHLSFDDNSRIIKSHYVVNDDGDAKVETKGSYSGMLSSYLRSGWEDQTKDYKKKDITEWLDEKDSTSFLLDTIMVEESSAEKPFLFKYAIKSTLKDVVSDAGDGVKAVKIHNVPKHYIFDYSKKTRTTTAFYPFRYSDEISVFIEFPKAVSILNEAEINKKVDNEIGSVEQTIAKLGPNMYKLTSTYKLKQNVITKEKYSLLVDLNKQVEQFNDVSVMYKVN